MEEQVRVLIIGSGPAGYTAAIYASRANLKPVLYEGIEPGGQLTTTTDVENFPGHPDSVSGPDLMGLMRRQAERFGADIRTGNVTRADLSSRPFHVVIDGEKEIKAETLIIATGATAKYLGLPSETKFRGQGVSACATCDGFFYRKKDVAVVGGGNTAMDAARAALRAGAKTSTLVYRRTKKYMPADAEELELAVEDGVRFLELVAPVEQANGKLKCEVMKLGDPDEKGRRSPVPTGEFTEIDCDTVIAAVGERVDSDLFTANGIEVNAKGIPEFRTNLENVFVGGDAMRGPATVVEGIADAQYFANAVIGSVHSVAIPDDAHATRDEAIARKGVLCPPKAGCEGERCLHCNTVCQVCADVCPNRANVVITLPDSRHEILHVDRMCNECGNCAVFCPYDSAPYRNKFTLFLTREGFDESTENQGFLPLEGRKVLVRLDGKVFEADLDGQNQLPADVETFILTVLKDYAYLL